MTQDQSASRSDSGWGPIRTVADLIRNLQTLPPDAGFHTVYFVEIDGKQVARARPPSMSWETIGMDGFHVEKYDPARRSVVMWASQEAPVSEPGFGWRPLGEKRPSRGGAPFVPVLFVLKEGENRVCAGRYFGAARRFPWRSLQGEAYKFTDVSHWMPIPDAPNER